MNDELRQIVIETLQRGEDLPAEWARELFPPEKREYELVYYGKEREEDILAETLAVPLQPVRTFSKDSSGWHNMLIFGDNLQVMKTLLKMKEKGQLVNSDGTPGVRLIYIDPPFATKRDFLGSQDQKAYQDKIAGAEFIEFIRKRLIIMRELLTSDGAIYVHLDWRKCHYIKAIMDEVFGEANFQNEIIWQRLSARSDSKTYNHIHDVIYFYTRTQTFDFNIQHSEYSEAYVKKFYRYKDEDGRQYSLGDLTARGLRNGESGQPWRGIDPAQIGNHWKVKISTLDELDKQGKIYWPPKGKIPRLKQYLDERQGRPLQSIWQDISPVQFASSEKSGYPTQKPEILVERIIRASSDPGDIVLDSFAGSGTTCAVAEKLGRRWIGIDLKKLAIYTIQKRILNLKTEIGNKGKPLPSKPFTLYNAGLYDFSTLKQLPWADWRFFALQLFGCKDEQHTIGGLKLDGKLKGASVLVFNHLKHPGQRIDEDTVHDIHIAVGKKIGHRFFIIAPRGVFDFQQDYIDFDNVRYYGLRIPYSIINELHHREFTALQQPNDETAVNDTVEAVGFDFIRPPQVEWLVGIRKRKRQLIEEAYLKVKKFESRAYLRGKDTRGGLETLSMLMLDFDYDGDVFDLDSFFYAHQLEEANWEARFPVENLGEKLMAVFIDIHGNESREVISRDKFGI